LVKNLAFLVCDSKVFARHFVIGLASAFSLSVESLNIESEACGNEQNVDNGKPPDSFFPEGEVLGPHLPLGDGRAEPKKLLRFNQVIING